MSRSNLVAGPKVTIYINGRAYAQVSDFRWTSETPKKAIYGIDSTEPYELAVTTTKVTGAVSLYRIIGDGGLEGIGVAAQFADLSREKYFSLTLVEHSSDSVLFQASRCSLVAQAWNVPSRGIVTGTMQFEAIDWVNETGSNRQ